MFKLPSLVSKDPEERKIAETIVLLKKAKADGILLEKSEIKWAESHVDFDWELTEKEECYLKESK